MQQAVYSQRDQELSAKRSRGKIALAAGIAGTFAVGALLGAQMAADDNSNSLFNLSSSDNNGGQLFCSDILASGEMRTYQHQWCATIEGTSFYPGNGKIHTEYCNGTGDQNYQFCSDGTIRNVNENTCLQSDGKYVEFEGCTNSKTMQWTLLSQGTWATNGVDQNLYALKNSNGQCMTGPSTTNGSGYFEMGSCISSEAKVYIQNNGKMVGSGTMVNQGDHECLYIDSRYNMDNADAIAVRSQTCTQSSELWSYYENGWIVNTGTGWCLQSSQNNGNGNVDTFPCTGGKNQNWKSTSSGDIYVFKNAASGNCFQSEPDSQRIAQCNTDPQQQFSLSKSSSGSWSTPEGYWSNDNCNESGSVSLTLTESVSYSSTLSAQLTESASNSIKMGLGWKGISFGMSTTHSTANAIGNSFTNAANNSETYTFDCQYYADTGDKFTTGCIWQGFVRMTNLSNNKPLTFNTSYVGCTPGAQRPICPPMETCSDSACTSCVNM